MSQSSIHSFVLCVFSSLGLFSQFCFLKFNQIAIVRQNRAKPELQPLLRLHSYNYLDQSIQYLLMNILKQLRQRVMEIREERHPYSPKF